ncbi:hypothetical protein CIB48_g1890 [Xylaria polymorpha]|nr:hypothetical protein CIB48_g1890 [Xylaria polymorpha]
MMGGLGKCRLQQLECYVHRIGAGRSEQASYTEAAVINLLTYVAVTKGLITHWYKVLGYGCCACTSLCENGDEKFYMIFRPNQFYCGLFVSGNQDPLQRTHAETETLFLAYRPMWASGAATTHQYGRARQLNMSELREYAGLAYSA